MRESLEIKSTWSASAADPLIASCSRMLEASFSVQTQPGAVSCTSTQECAKETPRCLEPKLLWASPSHPVRTSDSRFLLQDSTFTKSDQIPLTQILSMVYWKRWVKFRRLFTLRLVHTWLRALGCKSSWTCLSGAQKAFEIMVVQTWLHPLVSRIMGTLEFKRSRSTGNGGLRVWYLPNLNLKGVFESLTPFDQVKVIKAFGVTRFTTRTFSSSSQLPSLQNPYVSRRPEWYLLYRFER